MPGKLANCDGTTTSHDGTLLDPTYLTQTSAYDVDMTTLWEEQLYRGPASQLCFHPTKPLLAVASSDDRAVHAINFHNSMGEFVVCGVGVARPGQGGVNGLM